MKVRLQKVKQGPLRKFSTPCQAEQVNSHLLDSHSAESAGTHSSPAFQHKEEKLNKEDNNYKIKLMNRRGGIQIKENTLRSQEKFL